MIASHRARRSGGSAGPFGNDEVLALLSPEGPPAR